MEVYVFDMDGTLTPPRQLTLPPVFYFGKKTICPISQLVPTSKNFANNCPRMLLKRSPGYIVQWGISFS